MLNGPYTILIILIITMGFFIWGKWRYDIVAMIALALSILCGAVHTSDAYSGLDNPAVITVACVMIISQAISRSGILHNAMHKVARINQHFFLQISILTVVTAILSAFMNNVGALALMMPIALQSAYDNKRSPSLLLMPIALGSALGGLTTVIGTPPNLLVSAYRQQVAGSSFSMFDFSHAGLGVACIGVLFIVCFGWRLLKQRILPAEHHTERYKIEDYITEVKITKQSPIIGNTVKELETLVQGEHLIVGLIRNHQRRMVIKPSQELAENDILIIESPPADLQKLLHVAKLTLVADAGISTESLKTDNVGLMEAVVPQASRIEGRSSRSMRLRSRFQRNMLSIASDG